MTDYLRVECTFDLLNKARIEIGHGEDKKTFDTLVHLCKLMTGGKDIQANYLTIASLYIEMAFGDPDISFPYTDIDFQGIYCVTKKGSAVIPISTILFGIMDKGEDCNEDGSKRFLLDQACLDLRKCI